jgi:hypothetical protein
MACKIFQEMVTLDRMGRSKEMGLVLVRPVQTTSLTVSTSGHRRNLDCRGGSGFCTKESHNRLLVERQKFEKSTFPDCVPRVDFESCKGEAKALLDRSDNVKVKDENVEYVVRLYSRRLQDGVSGFEKVGIQVSERAKEPRDWKPGRGRRREGERRRKWKWREYR